VLRDTSVVSQLTIYRPRALTTPWPPPQRGGESVDDGSAVTRQELGSDLLDQ